MRSQSEWFFLLSLLLCIVYVSCWWWTQRALRELPSDPLLWPQEYRSGEESLSHMDEVPITSLRPSPFNDSERREETHIQWEPSLPRDNSSSLSLMPNSPTESAETPSPAAPNRITVIKVKSPSSHRRRRNPLFVGEVEEDFSVDDPYFNHGGNLSSFLRTYTALHNSLTASRSKRVVVYLPMKETGLGNSLLAVSSAFLYAVLTKRAFLLNYGQLTKHFAFPWQEPNSTFSFSRHPTTGFSFWNRHYNVMQPTDKSMRGSSPRTYNRQPGVIVTGFLGFFHLIVRHDNYTEKLVRMGFLQRQHVLDAAAVEALPSPQKERYYTDLATEASRVFLREVMKPQPWVAAMVATVLDGAGDKYRVGFHIRMGNSGSAFKDSHVFLTKSAIWGFAERGESVMRAAGRTARDTVWVLSTDSNLAEEELRAKYGEMIVTASGYRRGHSKTGAKDADGFTRAVIDLLLLSRCDYLVLTSHSTFSVIARTIARDGVPHYMMPSRG
ncbi:hypothetical protein WA556_004657, partial [Blastocystis sp. ATCC 50177/Nand II]